VEAERARIARELHDLVRGTHPWPGAFTILRDSGGRERKLKLFRGHLIGSGAAEEAIAVRAKDGELALDEVQLEGKRRMSAAEFRRGWSGQLTIG
jgi:methionyl-tRNA formyltransferase